MNDTLYKKLEANKVIDSSLEKIKKAFIMFYGEESKDYIEEKFKNFVSIAYGLPDELTQILYNIRKNETNKVMNIFFDKIEFNGDKAKMKEMLFSSLDFKYYDSFPIQKYIDYVDNINNPSSEERDYYKKRALEFLKKIDSSITIENMDELYKKGTFSEIDKMIPFYKEVLNIYQFDMKRIESFSKENDDDLKFKRELEQKCFFQLINEFSYLFPKEELDAVEKQMEEYGYISIYDKKIINSYVGNTLFSPCIIEAFSSKNDALLLNDKESWKAKSIIKDRIKFFNNMGINLGDDYESYINNDECKKIIPSLKIIDEIILRKNQLYDEFLSLYYKSTKEYQENKQKIEACGLLDKNGMYGPEIYFNKTKAIYPNLLIEDGKPILFPIMYMNISGDYLDVNIIHELNHIFELYLVNFDGESYTCSCGWDLVDVSLNDNEEENDKRKYELFNEIINELIAEDITKIMHDNGDYIFNTKENAKIVGGTSYGYTTFLAKDFYIRYKNEILQSRRKRDMKPLFDKVGEENFEELNNLFNIFNENFDAFKMLKCFEDLKSGKETELTKLYKELCFKKDEILNRMNEYDLQNDIKKHV